MMERYADYKDSGVDWLGDLPAGWDLKPLRRLVREHSGYGFPVDLQGDKDGTVPFLKVSDFSSTNRMIKTSNNSVSEKTIKIRNWKKVPAGSLVTAKIGEALRKNHRNILAVDALIDNNCIAFEPTDLNLLFCFYLHRIIDFDWFVNPGAVPSISVPKYKSLKVPVPPLPEQTAIAEFLDDKTTKIETLVGIKRRQIELLVERKQILIQNAVTKGLNPNAPMKDSGVDWIGEIPAGWQVKRVKHLGNAVIGLTYDPKNLCDENEGTLVLRSSNLKSGKFVYGEKKNVYVNVKIPKKLKIATNDILICSRNGSRDLIGKCAIATEVDAGASFGAFTTVFRSHLNNYIFHILNSSIFKQLSGLFLTSTINQLTISSLNSIQLPMPPNMERNEIAEFIQSAGGTIDRSIETLENQITKLKEYKVTLIDSAVTGKIKVV